MMKGMEKDEEDPQAPRRAKAQKEEQDLEAPRRAKAQKEEQDLEAPNEAVEMVEGRVHQPS